MQRITISENKIFKFIVPGDLHTVARDYVRNINWNSLPYRENKPEYGKSSPGKDSLHRKIELVDLCKFINAKLAEVSSEIGWDKCFSEIGISHMWANRSERGQWHHRHRHPFSLLSGIIYLEGESGRTWFSTENMYKPSTLFASRTLYDTDFEDVYKHEAEAGTMIIFPSQLEHSVDDNMTTEPRHTISFNSFFNGTAGSPELLSAVTSNLV